MLRVSYVLYIKILAFSPLILQYTVFSVSQIQSPHGHSAQLNHLRRLISGEVSVLFCIISNL